MRVSTAGKTPTAIAPSASTPAGWRQPNVRPATSRPNDATAAAAASAIPSATGTSSTPTSGTRHGNASRSCRTASAPNAATRKAARTAHVNRHARAMARRDQDRHVQGEGEDLQPRLPDRHRRHVDQPASRRAGEGRRDEVVPRPRERPRQVEHERARGCGETEPAHPGRRPPARRHERGHREQDGDERHDREDRRGHPDGDRRDDREHGSAARPLACRELEDPVDHVVARRRRVGGADPDRNAEQVDEPRHRGVGDQRGEPSGRDHSRRKGDGGVDRRVRRRAPGWSGTGWPTATPPPLRAAPARRR